MKLSGRIKRIFAAVTDGFIFSVLVRMVLFGFSQTEVSPQTALLLGLLVGGMITYVGIPLLLRQQTLGMRMHHLTFVNTSTINDGSLLMLRFLSQFVLNIIFLGIPLAINLFLLIWKGPSLSDYLFAKVMVKQAAGEYKKG